jgi:hypothetical protein
MTELQALIESIDHHNRMLIQGKKFVKQRIIGRPLKQIMLDKIGETWTGDYCTLCREYYNVIDHHCLDCPLHKIGQNCNTNGYSLWHNITYSNTWGEWCDAEQEMIDVLNQLMIKCREKDENK